MIRGILLAAGASRRMGTDKLDLSWRGAPMLEATLARWLAVPELDEILLVRRGTAATEAWPRVRVVIAADPDAGMGSSLASAAATVPPDTEAVVVGLADMPELASSTIAALVAAWRPLGPGGIVAPTFEGQRGHPVVFGAQYLPALRALAGDQGARELLRRHADAVGLVAVTDPGVRLDLDTPEDLRRRA